MNIEKSLRLALHLCLLALISYGLAGNACSYETFTSDIELSDTVSKAPLNKLILGNNVQWVDRGDEILLPGTTSFNTKMLQPVSELKTTVLRYPGGSLSDYYHWKDGLGPVKDRKENRRYHSAGKDLILFGTIEFLELCEILGAEPMITVNVVTGTPEEAAEWVEYINIKRARSSSGKLLPKVRYWEIGNEPYLINENQKEDTLTPDEYARRANLFIRAMKKTDPEIITGIPLRNDMLGNIPATPMQGYSRTVLTKITEPFEYVSLHNAYLPLIFSDMPSKQDLYLTTMAATETVKNDFNHTRALLRELLPDRKIKLALTEYNSLFTLGRGESDAYITSTAGAMYMADLLCLLAETDDLLMANFWSLTGNWFFGTIGNDYKIRPAYTVLKTFGRMLDGNLISMQIQAPGIKTPENGFVTSQSNISSINGFAVKKGNIIQMILLNKHPDKKAKIKLSLQSGKHPVIIEHRSIAEPDVFKTAEESVPDEWPLISLTRGKIPTTVQCSPKSISFIEIKLQ